jgi:hypothetical protein
MKFQPHGCMKKLLRKYTKNELNTVPVFNKNLPRAHTESELDVLGVPGKLVKYVIHSFKRKNWKKMIFLHTSCPNSNRPVFGLKEFFRINFLLISSKHVNFSFVNECIVFHWNVANIPNAWINSSKISLEILGIYNWVPISKQLQLNWLQIANKEKVALSSL